MKLTADEFYELVPRQLDALLKRHKSSLASTELLFAQIASAVYNTGFRSTEKPVTPMDFMPSQWAQPAKSPKSSPKRIRMTKKRRQAIADGLRETLGKIAKVK